MITDIEKKEEEKKILIEFLEFQISEAEKLYNQKVEIMRKASYERINIIGKESRELSEKEYKFKTKEIINALNFDKKLFYEVFGGSGRRLSSEDEKYRSELEKIKIEFSQKAKFLKKELDKEVRSHRKRIEKIKNN